MTTFKIPKATGRLGESIDVKIQLLPKGTEVSFAFSFQFEPDVLRLDGMTLATTPDGLNLSTNEMGKDKGLIGLLIDGIRAFPKSRKYVDVLMLRFTPLKVAKTVVNFSPVPVKDSVSTIEGKLIPAKFVGGKVTVKK